MIFHLLSGSAKDVFEAPFIVWCSETAEMPKPKEYPEDLKKLLTSKLPKNAEYKFQ